MIKRDKETDGEERRKKIGRQRARGRRRKAESGRKREDRGGKGKRRREGGCVRLSIGKENGCEANQRQMN